MIKTSLALLAFVTQLHAAECGKPLGEAGTRPDKKTLGPGATLVVKDKLVKVDGDDEGKVIYVPTDQIKAYAPEVPLFATTTYRLQPGQVLRTLTKMKRAGGVKIVRVEFVPGGEKAVMYWTDIYYNTLVTAAGKPLPPKPAVTKRKFPNKCRRAELTRLWAEGQTAWGRPRAELGQTVWVATHTRAMSRGSVGVLTEINPGHAVVTNLYGKSLITWHHDCVPLTDKEIAWFKD